MAISFGTVTAHSHALHYGATWDGGQYTIAMWFLLNTASAAAKNICGSLDAAAQDGLVFNMDANEAIEITHYDAGATTVSTTTDVISTGTWIHLGAYWDGSNVRVYHDGVLDSGGALVNARTPDASGENFVLGDWPGGAGGGCAFAFAHFVMWDNGSGGAGKIRSHMVGILQDAHDIDLWVRGEATPGYNSITGVAGTAANTPVSLSEYVGNSGRAHLSYMDMEMDPGPRINRQDVALEPGPQLNRQTLLSDDYGPVMPQHGDVVQLTQDQGPFLNPQHVALVEHGPFLNPQHVSLTEFGYAYADRGFTSLLDSAGGLNPGGGDPIDPPDEGIIGLTEVGAHIEETVVSADTSSETVVKKAPSTISTTWTTGTATVTTTWKKGRNSYA